MTLGTAYADVVLRVAASPRLGHVVAGRDLDDGAAAAAPSYCTTTSPGT